VTGVIMFRARAIVKIKVTKKKFGCRFIVV
jgi:hypothetical protein